MILDMDGKEVGKKTPESPVGQIRSTTEPKTGLSLDMSVFTPTEENNAQNRSTVASGAPLMNAIRKRLFIMVDIGIYPDGRVYPGQPRCWFEGKDYQVAPKKKKVEIKQTRITTEKEEVY